MPIYERINISAGQFRSDLLGFSNDPLYRLFVYLSYTTVDSFQYGLGYETRDTLQRTHVMSGLASIHSKDWLQRRVEAQGIILTTKKLQTIFDDHSFLILCTHRGGTYLPADILDVSRRSDPYIYLGSEFIEAIERLSKRVSEETQKLEAENELRKEARRAVWEAEQAQYADLLACNREAREYVWESQLPIICPKT